MTSAIEIRSLAKRFGAQVALAGVDLDLGAGEVLGLLGPNGAGKSTLCRALVGRVRPDSGTIRVLGRDVNEAGARDALGWAPQEIALHGTLSARENLELWASYQGLAGARRERAVGAALAFASLEERAGDIVDSFSGGMKRRLNLVIANLASPRVLLLDEPTTGVDPQSRERLFAMIEELAASGVAILYTTHYLEEAERLCDRIVIVDHGRTIASGTREELVERAVGRGRRIELVADGAIPTELAAEFPGATTTGERIELVVDDAAGTLHRLLGALERSGREVVELEIVTPGLAEVFLRLTGRELRE